MEAKQNLSEIFDQKISYMDLLYKSGRNEEMRLYADGLLNVFLDKFDANSKIFSYNNDIEKALLLRKDKNANLLSFKFHLIYYYIALSYMKEYLYDEAISYFQKANAIDMFDYNSIKSSAECYMQKGDMISYKDVILNSHKNIYNVENLTDFYLYLGNYYYSMKDYTSSNMLYSYAEYYKSNSDTQARLNKVATELKRLPKKDNIQDILSFLNLNSIPSKVDDDMLKELLAIYDITNNKENMPLHNEVKKDIYGLTRNSSFASLKMLKDDALGFSFYIPDDDKVIGKFDYNSSSKGKNTLFVIKDSSNMPITINDICLSPLEDIAIAYQKIKESYQKDGYNIEQESKLRIGNSYWIEAFISRNLLNEKIIDVHNYTILNGHVIDFTSPLTNDYKSLVKMTEDESVKKIDRIIATVKNYELVDKKEEKKEEFMFFN